jgi:hypothetical protein
MMRPLIFARHDGTLVARRVCSVTPLLRWSSVSTTPAFRFRAVLTNDRGIEAKLNTV